MRGSVPSILEALAEVARERAAQLRRSADLDILYEEALRFEKRPFAAALEAPGVSVIAEVKRASPSAGDIRELDPAGWAERYEREGARCLSVLTEPSRFRGSMLDLDAARERTALPVLRKDFTVDEAQVIEAATRADAVLLIVALFKDAKTLSRYVSLAGELGLAALVEVHDEREASLALEAGAGIVGVNNRDLRDFSVDLATTERLAPLLGDVVLVAESGVREVADARRLRDAGADAVLVGEAAVRDPSLVRRISSMPW
ncbi:indole-3-glycerol phosphate synthase TrpC [Rubrobacter naiadicus]|uniref:indole-3-glycerol phosphate synthase TrpC n=1 Tax=Rubrobacter naiadicus TaxID=1392641 RepID=UPI00235F3805|nr:indole-3-glycerol phosphate synthase TrpC [Rubrobacter naiadicus]